MIIGEDQCEVYEIQEGDPLSAKVTIKREYIMEYPTFNTTGLKTKVCTHILKIVRLTDKHEVRLTVRSSLAAPYLVIMLNWAECIN